MQCSAPRPEDQIGAVDAAHLAVGEELRQGVQRDAVVRVVEGRDEHQPVGDVEVGVAGREPLPSKKSGAGIGSFTDLQSRAAFRALRFSAEVRSSRRCDRLPPPRPPSPDRRSGPGRRRGRGCRRRRCRRSSQMSSLDAQVIARRPARSRRGRARGCAPARRAEQALLGGQQQPCAVDVDAAALRARAPGSTAGDFSQLRDSAGTVSSCC